MSWPFTRAQGSNLLNALFGIKEISIDEVVEKLKNGERFYFIDARDEDDWEEGHARGAEHMPDRSIRIDIKEKIPDLNAEIVIYCAVGLYSLYTTDKLQRMGYTNVYSMTGGYLAWKNAKYPIVIEDE